MSVYIGRCRNGHTVRTTADQVNAGGGWVACGCGLLTVPTTLRTAPSDRECNAICTGATGRDCNCSCNGENHGAGKVYTPNPDTTKAGTQ